MKEETVMKTTTGTTITKGSGNVFVDLGFSYAESRNLQLRSQMMTALRKFIEKESLTQADAAKRLKVSQPRISDLTRGKISRFSLDTLVNMLADAGLEVDVRIKRPSRRVA
jgi:predicted XRE-type DNA-binding protein